MKSQHFDILIVGGGMVGLTAAAALKQTGLSIGLVERSSQQQLLEFDLSANQIINPEDYSIRVSAISPANQTFLSQLNVWQRIPTNRYCEYQKMHVWDADGSGEIEFDAAELSVKSLGSLVENHVVQAALIQSLLHTPNVNLIDGQGIQSLETVPDQVKVTLNNGEQLAAKLLIGADGSHSLIRKTLNIPISEASYQQTAFVATVKTTLEHQHTAWQRFTPTGPVAFLPLPDKNLCSIVWSVDDNKATNIKSMDKISFANALSAAFEKRLGDVELCSDFQGFPLWQRNAANYLQQRCVLVGDAAHTIHPLAGQGVNLGFQDVEMLCQQISQLLSKGKDFSNLEYLKPFERERKFHNRLTQESMTGLKWLFGHPGMGQTLARNIGINWINRSEFIKQQIAAVAMGI